MKKIAIIALLATGLAASASAAATAGFEAAYLTDSKEAYWAGHVGWEFKTTASLSHQVELEVAYTEETERVAFFTGTLKLTPIMINYRAETTAANKLGFYFGGGLGQARVSMKVSGSGVPTLSDSDTSMAIQAFTGVTYKATPTVTLHAGVRYLKIYEATMFGDTHDVGDDFGVGGGVSIKF